MDESGPTELIYSKAGSGLVYKYANGVELIHRPIEAKPHCHFVGTEGEIRVMRGELVTIPESLKEPTLRICPDFNIGTGYFNIRSREIIPCISVLSNTRISIPYSSKTDAFATFKLHNCGTPKQITVCCELAR